MKQHATYRPDGEATSGDFDGTVVFDVGGRLFRVLRQTIQTRPSALLASLVDDLGTDSSRPMFIDANPDRFSYILDWYRYGEMFIPNDSTIEAVLRDARFFLLPDVIRINGMSHAIHPIFASEAHDAMMTTVTSSWPSFEDHIRDICLDIKAHFEDLGANTSEPRHFDATSCDKETLAHSTFPPKEIQLSTLLYRNDCSWYRWLDPGNVCNKERLWVLIAELERRGFDCTLPNSGPVTLRVGLRKLAAADEIGGRRGRRVGNTAATGAVQAS
mmetsp:Transcript_99438/g.197035  ORF Transcript_99438/g.197035 Transcript_99438/m.197035 type:complete len:272 (+) Transcript_99438:111-926(+)